MLFGGKTEEVLQGKSDVPVSDENRKKYKNTALKPFAGTAASRHNKIMQGGFKNMKLDSLMSAPEQKNGLNLV